MVATETEKATSDVQSSLFGGEHVRQRKPPSSRNPPTANKVEGKNRDEKTPRRPLGSWADEPITHAMYVAKDLETITLTGYACGLPEDTMQQVFDGEAVATTRKTYKRLTPELYRELREQLDAIHVGNVPAEKREQVFARWEAIAQWAAIEGWV